VQMHLVVTCLSVIVQMPFCPEIYVLYVCLFAFWYTFVCLIVCVYFLN
jgi:hypothetical protein